jgi:hypothetical protein
MRSIAPVLLAVSLGSPAMAAEYLTSVTSEVFQTEGTHDEIARRAQSCIAQKLHAANGPVILSSDPEAGIVTARNEFEYGNLPRWKLRSTLTLEAKDGRFRMVHTNIERFNDGALGGPGWYGVGKWWGSGSKRVEKELTDTAAAVAKCVMGREAKNDW